MSEWQPISTAPKDGTLIIMHGTAESGPSSAFMKPFEHLDTGYFAHNMWQSGTMWRWKHPTHWQPLPKPPEHEVKK